MMRSSVDLPEPERPSRPTISPSTQREVDVVEHQQARPTPLRERLAHCRDVQQRQRPWARSSVAWRFLSRAAGGVRLGVERPPEHAVEEDDEQRHDRDAKHDARIVARPRSSARYRRRGPAPSSLVSPQLTTSATMLAFHAPPEAVIAPVT